MGIKFSTERRGPKFGQLFCHDGGKMNKDPCTTYIYTINIDNTVMFEKIYRGKVKNSRWLKCLSGKYLNLRNTLIKHKEQETSDIPRISILGNYSKRFNMSVIGCWRRAM